MEVSFRYAVVAAHMSLSLVPKVLNTVDMTFLFDECFRMIYPDVVELRAGSGILNMGYKWIFCLEAA